MQRAATIGFWLAAALPAALTLVLILHYGVNVPYADQWTLVSMFAKFETGKIAWSELFELHNEHRIALPKLVMLMLAQITRWNTRAEMVASLMLAAGQGLILCLLARPLLRSVGPAARLVAVLLVSLLLFSLTQWENWLWGFQLTWLLHNFTAVSAIALAAWSLESRDWRLPFAGAVLAAILCQLSLAGGVAVWPAVALVLLLHPRRLIVVPLWLGIGVVVTALYLHGYRPPTHHPAFAAIVERPLVLPLYVANYLAAPFGRSPPYGAAVLLAFIGLGAAAIAIHKRLQLATPWLALGGFALANAVLTGIGRAGFGPGQALDSRYATVAVLVPIATVFLGVLVLAGTRNRAAAPLLAAAAIVAMVLVIRQDVGSLPAMQNLQDRLVAGRHCLLAIEVPPDDCLANIYPIPSVVRTLAPQLATIGWSGYGPPEARRVRSLRLNDGSKSSDWRVLPDDGTFGMFDGVHIEGDALVASGWAAHPERRRQPRHRVLVVAGDRIVLEAETVRERPDVAGYLKDPSLAVTGWLARAPFARPGAPLTLRAFVVIEDGLLAPLSGDKRLP